MGLYRTILAQSNDVDDILAAIDLVRGLTE